MYENRQQQSDFEIYIQCGIFFSGSCFIIKYVKRHFVLIKLVSEIRDALRDELEMEQIGALTCKMQQIGDIFNFTKHKHKTVTASQKCHPL